MRRELVGAGLATAVLVGGAFLGSTAVAQPGGEGAGAQAAAAGPVKDPDAPRQQATTFGPHDVVVKGGVARVWGENRYDTAAVIAEAYGWTADNTISVYIASGLNSADALAIGPSTYDDGPLLLVSKNLPSQTRAALDALRPCYIHVIGGPTVISDTTLGELQKYAYPELCAELP